MSTEIETFENELPPLGNSTDALLGGMEIDQKRHEKAMEILNNYLKCMASGEDIEPIIIARQDGKMFVERVEKDADGNLILPQIETLTTQDLKRKRKLVQRIMKKVTPALLNNIENVTFIALMRKDEDKLIDAVNAFNQRGISVRIENRLGCIWVIVGQYEFVI